MKYLFILVGLLLASCTPKATEESHTILIDDVKNVTLTPNDIFTDYELIPLETRKECLIGDITKIEVYNGIYYILDCQNQKSILAFDENGKYIRRIGKVGSGPEEYPQIRDFTIDQINGRIIILSPPSIVYVYDMDGKFLLSKDLKVSSFENISTQGNNIICYTKHLTYTEGEGAFLIFRFDEKFNLIDKYIPVYQKQLYSPSTISVPIQGDEQNTYVIDAFTHKIYSMGNDVKVYPVQLSNPMPTEKFAEASLFMQHMRDYDYIFDAAVIDSTLAFNYIHNGNLYYTATDFNNRVQYSGRYSGIKPPFMDVVGDTIISYMNVIQYDEYWKEKINHVFNDSISIDDNYLIMRFRLK